MDKTKMCSKCKRELPMTKDYFHIQNSSKDGFKFRCKDCIKSDGQEYYRQNKEVILPKRKKYKQDNKETISIYNKKYRYKNKEIIKIKTKIHYDNNKDYYKEYNQKHKERIAVRKNNYYKNNIDSIMAYREDNKEKIALAHKLHKKENAERYKMYGQRRRAKKRALPSTLTTKQWEDIKSSFNDECSYCGSGDNLEQEHFVALSKGGEYTHNNIIPSCKSCNCSKQDRDFFKWYPKQKFYAPKREDFILRYLGYELQSNTQQLSIL